MNKKEAIERIKFFEGLANKSIRKEIKFMYLGKIEGLKEAFDLERIKEVKIKYKKKK